MFYLVFGYSKIRQKRSSVSSVLQPIVAPSFAIEEYKRQCKIQFSCTPTVRLCLCSDLGRVPQSPIRLILD